MNFSLLSTIIGLPKVLKVKKIHQYSIFVMKWLHIIHWPIVSFGFMSAFHWLLKNVKWKRNTGSLWWPVLTVLSPCCFPSLPDGRRHVSVPVYEALHGRGNVQAPSGLLSASPQQLLRLFWPVPPSRRLGRTWPQSFLHLLWGFPPNELLQFSCPPQVPRIWTHVFLTLLRQTMNALVILICSDFATYLSDNLISFILKFSL